MEIEIQQLELKYQNLRINNPDRRARLVASLLSEGQRSPVLVVQQSSEQYILIDGYMRVSALLELSRDIVDAVVLPVSEAEALLLRFSLETTRPRTALEEGWILHELVKTHGMTLRELASRLHRSPSWVSRRLSLVRVLPLSAQQSIKSGLIPAQAAAKFLVPLSRDNVAQCEQLVENLRPRRVTARQLECLYRGWRCGDAEQRHNIVSEPWLYLRVSEELSPGGARSNPNDEPGLLSDLERFTRLIRRIVRRINSGELKSVGDQGWCAAIDATWKTVQRIFETLSRLMATRE
jgi:ParB/RepB/Spo0J family partition protein